MLEAKTEKQKREVLKILGTQETCCHFPLDFDKDKECNDRIYLDGNISFDTMAKIVDYLRSVSENE